MRWLPLPLALSLALAATAGLAADSPLRPEQMRQAMGLKLGEWRSETRLVDVKIEPAPGGTAADAERAVPSVRASLSGPETLQCLWDDRERLYLPGIRGVPGCDYSGVEVRDGRFALTAVCKQPDKADVVQVAVEGRYGPEQLSARSEVRLSIKGMRVLARLDTESRFVGKCRVAPLILTPPTKGN
ncbi:MAG TPA: DUF3617 family protein [Allosphingosinicella sp.]|jgi:hypothetical protein